MFRAALAVLLWFSACLWAKDPPAVPQVHPDEYPEGTIFSVVMSPRNEIGWAASQDPELPPVTRLDGTQPPVLPYNIHELATSEAKEWAVVRSGGHHTIAQLMHYYDATPEMQQRYQTGQSFIERDNLRGYVAVTVKFRRMKNGAWYPDIVSWKSHQLNLANVRAWRSDIPPIGVKTDVFTRITLAINKRQGTMVPCQVAFPAIRQFQSN